VVESVIGMGAQRKLDGIIPDEPERRRPAGRG
jgi:hypothetical protein